MQILSFQLKPEDPRAHCNTVFSGLSCISKCSFSISSPTSLHFFLIRTTLNTTSHDLQESYIHMQQSQGKTISIYLMDGTSEGR